MITTEKLNKISCCGTRSLLFGKGSPAVVPGLYCSASGHLPVVCNACSLQSIFIWDSPKQVVSRLLRIEYFRSSGFSVEQAVGLLFVSPGITCIWHVSASTGQLCTNNHSTQLKLASE